MKTQFQYEVISRLKKLREEISPGQLGNIESYKQAHKFTLAQILKICDTLDIDILDILLPEKGEDVKPREVIEAIVKYQEKME